jgi:hypothetical protein
LRDNGAIIGGAGGFSTDDEVIVLRKLDGSKVYVIGHIDGVRVCGDFADLVVLLLTVTGYTGSIRLLGVEVGGVNVKNSITFPSGYYGYDGPHTYYRYAGTIFWSPNQNKYVYINRYQPNPNTGGYNHEECMYIDLTGVISNETMFTYAGSGYSMSVIGQDLVNEIYYLKLSRRKTIDGVYVHQDWLAILDDTFTVVNGSITTDAIPPLTEIEDPFFIDLGAGGKFKYGSGPIRLSDGRLLWWSSYITGTGYIKLTFTYLTYPDNDYSQSPSVVTIEDSGLFNYGGAVTPYYNYFCSVTALSECGDGLVYVVMRTVEYMDAPPSPFTGQVKISAIQYAEVRFCLDKNDLFTYTVIYTFPSSVTKNGQILVGYTGGNPVFVNGVRTYSGSFSLAQYLERNQLITLYYGGLGVPNQISDFYYPTGAETIDPYLVIMDKTGPVIYTEAAGTMYYVSESFASVNP